MPKYEYACNSCGQHLEVTQSFSDEPLTSCPHCGGPLRKVFGSIGIVLKGSGFYKTDSRSSSKASAGAKKESSSADSSGASSEATSSATSSDKGASDKGASDKGTGEKSSSGDKSSTSSTAAAAS